MVPNWYIGGAQLPQLVNGVILGYSSIYMPFGCKYGVKKVEMLLVPNWYKGGAELPQLVHGVILGYFSIYMPFQLQC